MFDGDFDKPYLQYSVFNSSQTEQVPIVTTSFSEVSEYHHETPQDLSIQTRAVAEEPNRSKVCSKEQGLELAVLELQEKTKYLDKRFQSLKSE